MLVLTINSFNVGAFPTKLSAPQKSVSDMQWLSDGLILREGRSTLVRRNGGIRMNMYTSELKHGDAVSVWWVVFNHPENCTHGTMGERCGEGDIGADGVNASIIYADGHVVRHTGRVIFNSMLISDRMKGVVYGNGLFNPTGADVHLIVRDHGKVIPGMMREMIRTFDGGCNVESEDGENSRTGLNDCVNLQYSVHESREIVGTSSLD